MVYFLPSDLAHCFFIARYGMGKVFFKDIGLFFQFDYEGAVTFGNRPSIFAGEEAVAGFQQVIFFSGSRVGQRKAFDLVDGVEEEAFVEEGVGVSEGYEAGSLGRGYADEGKKLVFFFGKGMHIII